MPTALYAADTDATPQGGSGGTDDARKVRPSDLVEKYSGDILKMAEKLADTLNDNFRYRKERDDLRENQTPAGATVLTGDDATAWQQYQQLGSAADLAARISSADAAQQRLAALERMQTLQQAAALYGYSAAVLSKLPDLPPISMADTMIDGTATPQAVVTTDSGPQPLPAYLEQQYAEFMPAVCADQGSRSTPYPSQVPNDQGSARQNVADALFAQFQAQRDSKPNPLASQGA